MNARRFVATMIFVNLGATLCFAQSQGKAASTAEAPKRVDFNAAIRKFVDEETSASIRYRNQHRNDGTRSHNQAQYRLDLHLKFQLTPEGKLVLRSRALTGARFDSAWDETGIGDSVDRSFNLRMRQIFLDYSPTENLNVQGGSIPVMHSSIKGKGALSIDTDGWVDGARVSYAKLASWAKQITVTVGQVDEYQSTNMFRRGWGSPNFIQVHVQGDMLERMRHVLEYTRLGEDDYLRVMAEIALVDIVPFIDSVVLEDVVRLGGDGGQDGFGAAIKKAIGDWKITGQYSYKSAYISRTGEGALLLEDLYRQGHQITVTVERKTRWGTPFVSVGKVVSGNKTVSNQGLRVEGGIKVNLPKRK